MRPLPVPSSCAIFTVKDLPVSQTQIHQLDELIELGQPQG